MAIVVLIMMIMVMMETSTVIIQADDNRGMPNPDYSDALHKSLLFFEGQRSGKLPPNQRVTWRKDSGLKDGSSLGADLVGGYYDAGDNVKFHFPMAYTVSLLAWGVIEFGEFMGEPELENARDAVKWGADYILKATSEAPEAIFAHVADPVADHSCWERPEDMDTPREAVRLTAGSPGSDVAAEMAAALAASSLVFKGVSPLYSRKLIVRAVEVFKFADMNRGSYSSSICRRYCCPFYCSSGYLDELVWAATWIYYAGNVHYWKYVIQNAYHVDGNPWDFGWDRKNAGINILAAKMEKAHGRYVGTFIANADMFICTIFPNSPTRTVNYSPGGLLFGSQLDGGSNLQHISYSLLALIYANSFPDRHVKCGTSLIITQTQIINLARTQVNYILGHNPIRMSYMVRYGPRFPQRIHHRGSSLPSLASHPPHITCAGGYTQYFRSTSPNPNLLVGAVVGGPDYGDRYVDDRWSNASYSEPTTYIVAPLVGLLGYFKAHP